MHRKLIMVFLAVTTLASMSVAPSAFAEQKPTNQFIILNPKAVCVVLGLVTTLPGVEFPTPHKNLYLFLGVRIICTSLGTLTNYGPTGRTSSFSVLARGCTDGPFLLGGRNGETSLEGWSSSSGCSLPYRPGAWDKEDCNKKAGDNYNKGNILVRPLPRARDTTKSALGWVKFTRRLSVVKAWGKLDWALAGKKQLCFIADLNFEPDQQPPLIVTTARLDGVAVVGNYVIQDPKK